MKQDRLGRERYTIQVMIEIFCRDTHHISDALCIECQQLYGYAMQRIAACPYLADKPACGKCPIHCYKPAMREQIRRVMRHAGPRMVFSHPLLTIRHYIDAITKTNTSKAEARGKRE